MPHSFSLVGSDDVDEGNASPKTTYRDGTSTLLVGYNGTDTFAFFLNYTFPQASPAPELMASANLRIFFSSAIAGGNKVLILSVFNNPEQGPVVGGTTVLTPSSAAGETELGRLTIPSTVEVADPLDFTINVTLLNQITSSLLRTGTNMTFVVRSADFTTIHAINIGAAEDAFGAQLTAVQFPFITGKSGPYKAQGRVARCPRCGFLVTKDVLINDGFVRGLRVCPRCYDPPEDRANRRLPLERDREGEGRWGR